MEMFILSQFWESWLERVAPSWGFFVYLFQYQLWFLILIICIILTSKLKHKVSFGVVDYRCLASMLKVKIIFNDIYRIYSLKY